MKNKIRISFLYWYTLIWPVEGRRLLYSLRIHAQHEIEWRRLCTGKHYLVTTPLFFSFIDDVISDYRNQRYSIPSGWSFPLDGGLDWGRWTVCHGHDWKGRKIKDQSGGWIIDQKNEYMWKKDRKRKRGTVQGTIWKERSHCNGTSRKQVDENEENSKDDRVNTL